MAINLNLASQQTMEMHGTFQENTTENTEKPKVICFPCSNGYQFNDCSQISGFHGFKDK